MIAALIFAGLLAVQSRQDFWIVTEANDREVSVVNVGRAFVPEGENYILAQVHTQHRQGTAATQWTTPAYTDESIAVRCADQTFLVRHSSISSSVADPIRVADPDGAFVSVATDPKRRRQAEAVCRPRADHMVGSRDLYELLGAHGIRTGGPANPPRLAGPQPYPVAPGERASPQEPVGGSPPRIGVVASWRNSPGGGLVIGYAQNSGGRWITEFYSMSPWAADPAIEAVVFVRRALDAYEAQEQIRWADSRTCPGLVEAMLPANDLPLPALILPLDEGSRIRGRDAGYPPPPAPDGPGPHIFWAPARGPMAMDLQFSANGGAWVDWARSVDRVLEPCWRDERPVAPPREW